MKDILLPIGQGAGSARAKVNVVVMRKISILARNHNAGCSDHSPVTMYCTEGNFGCLEERNRYLMQVRIIRIKFIFITLFH